MIRTYEATQVEVAAVLKTASEAVTRVKQRGYVSAFFHALSDTVTITAAEAKLDQWVTVLTAAVATALGGETLAQLRAASEASAAHMDRLAAQQAQLLAQVCAEAAAAVGGEEEGTHPCATPAPMGVCSVRAHSGTRAMQTPRLTS